MIKRHVSKAKTTVISNISPRPKRVKTNLLMWVIHSFSILRHFLKGINNVVYVGYQISLLYIHCTAPVISKTQVSQTRISLTLVVQISVQRWRYCQLLHSIFYNAFTKDYLLSILFRKTWLGILNLIFQLF